MKGLQGRVAVVTGRRFGDRPGDRDPPGRGGGRREYGRIDFLVNNAGIQIAAANGIGPGATITPINRAWVEDPEKRALVKQHIPMRRAGAAEEMAAVTAFLLWDEAAYITGQTLFVDGGLTLYPSFESTWSSG